MYLDAVDERKPLATVAHDEGDLVEAAQPRRRRAEVRKERLHPRHREEHPAAE